jgi:hypothetical protein
MATLAGYEFCIMNSFLSRTLAFWVDLGLHLSAAKNT